jgi:hypothetical protein
MHTGGRRPKSAKARNRPNAVVIVRRIVDPTLGRAARPDVVPEADQQAGAVVARVADRIASSVSGI